MLQLAFSGACNDISVVVQQRRLWNRVTLHHLMYRLLRDTHPQLGSQLVCNAIYSVCRSARLVYQHQISPYSQLVATGKPLPLLRFSQTAPVLFDRRTLSLRNGVASIYTLDGRMHCACDVEQQDEAMFAASRVHELILQRSKAGAFELLIDFRNEASKRPARRAVGELFIESLPEGLHVQEMH